MKSGALAEAAEALDVALPTVVLDHVKWTSQVDVLSEQDFGLALRAGPHELVTVFISGSERTARAVRGLTKAFLGPNHAWNRLPASVVEKGDPFGSAIDELAGASPLQVLATPTQHRVAYLQSLRRLLAVQSRTPPLTALAARPLAAILRDFEAAIVRGDVAEAVAMRDQAWSTGRLSLVNRSFLDARLRAAEADFEGLLDHVRRLRLADIPMPGPVEHVVVDAVGQCLLPSPDECDRDTLAQAFRAQVAPEFGAVFRDHRVAASSAARWAWAAHYLSLDPVPHAALDEVIAQAEGDERERLGAISGANRAQQPSPADLRALAEGGENAAVFAAARASGDLPAEVREDALKRSTAALRDPVRAAEARAIVARQRVRLDPDGPNGVSGVPTEKIGPPASPFTDVDDWESWLLALFAHPDGDDALKVLDSGAARWTERLRSQKNDLHGWAGYVEVLAGEPAFRRALPMLVQAVLPDGPDAETVATARAEVLLAFTYAIAEDAEPGTAGLDALGDLAGALVVTGLGDDDYRKVVSRCETVYRRLSTPARLARWVLDITCTILEGPAPSDQTRDGAIRRLVALLLPDARRARPLVGPEVWTELGEVLKDVDGLQDALPTLRTAAESDVGNTFSFLQGKTVLLHTLVEAAAQRARAYLETVADVRVLIDSSQVGGSKLREQAATADLVVVAWRASKHAAFETIRPAAGERLAYARGKGWSSLITAVNEASGRWT